MGKELKNCQAYKKEFHNLSYIKIFSYSQLKMFKSYIVKLVMYKDAMENITKSVVNSVGPLLCLVL